MHRGKCAPSVGEGSGAEHHQQQHSFPCSAPCMGLLGVLPPPSFLQLPWISQLSNGSVLPALGCAAGVPGTPLGPQILCKLFSWLLEQKREGMRLGCRLNSDCLQASSSGCRQGPIDAAPSTEWFSCSPWKSGCCAVWGQACAMGKRCRAGAVWGWGA